MSSQLVLEDRQSNRVPLPSIRSHRAPRRSSQPIADPKFSLARLRLEQNEPFVEPEGNLQWSYRIAKRALDIVGAMVAIVLLSPLLAGVFILLCITTRGRPLIRQERVGYLGRRFGMYKFRSMRLDAEKLQHLVANEQSRPDLQKPPRSADHSGRADSPPHQHRRNAATVQRLARPHVAGRSAPAAGQRSGQIQSLATSPIGHPARPDVPVASQRPIGNRLRRMGPHGYLVSAKPNALERFAPPDPHAAMRAELPGSVLRKG